MEFQTKLTKSLAFVYCELPSNLFTNSTKSYEKCIFCVPWTFLRFLTDSKKSHNKNVNFVYRIIFCSSNKSSFMLLNSRVSCWDLFYTIRRWTNGSLNVHRRFRQSSFFNNNAQTKSVQTRSFYPWLNETMPQQETFNH